MLTAKRLLVNRLELAELLGVHPDRITKFAGEGMPVEKQGGRSKAGEYDAAACLRWARERRAPGNQEQERTRYFAAQADKTELENRVRRGEVAELAAMESTVAGLVVAARDRLRGIPAVARQTGLVDKAGEEALARLIDDALVELAERGSDGH